MNVFHGLAMRARGEEQFAYGRRSVFIEAATQAEPGSIKERLALAAAAKEARIALGAKLRAEEFEKDARDLDGVRSEEEVERCTRVN